MVGIRILNLDLRLRRWSTSRPRAQRWADVGGTIERGRGERPRKSGSFDLRVHGPPADRPFQCRGPAALPRRRHPGGGFDPERSAPDDRLQGLPVHPAELLDVLRGDGEDPPVVGGPPEGPIDHLARPHDLAPTAANISMLKWRR